MPARSCLALALTLALGAPLGCGDDGEPPADAGGVPDAGPPDASADSSVADAGPFDDPAARYPAEPDPPTGAACVADRAAHWTFTTPAACETGRLCVDERGRTWHDGAPIVLRGLYQSGFEAEAVLGNCPAGAACQATQPADHEAYVAVLGDAGFNLLVDEMERLSPELKAAVDADDRVFLTHVLFGDPFTEEGHDAFVAEIERNAEDPELLMWFGPDEPDLNRTWPMATGFRRLLSGASAETDALLAGRYRPDGDPFLPADEPAHDPHGLPYASAVVIDATGLAVFDDVYDALLPVTYPFQEPMSPANAGIWTTDRTATFQREDRPAMPVHQMGGLDGLGLIRPSPAQIRAAITTTLALGADGAFYFRLASDDPPFAGRAGWYAPDDVDGWAAFAETHALWDALVPALYGDAVDERGEHGVLDFRRLTLGDRRVLILANPTPFERFVDLDAIIARGESEHVRRFEDCAPFTTRALTVPGYATWVLEVVPAAAPAPGAPGDPLAGHPPPLPEEPAAEALDGPWRTLTPLPSGRSQLALVWDARGVHAIGGYQGTLNGSRAGVTLGADGPQALPDLRLGVAGPVAAAIGGDLIVAGGVPSFASSSPITPHDSCQRLAAGAAEWIECADAGNGPVSGAPHVVFDGRLYVFGGLSREDFSEGGPGSLASTVVQVYDPAEDRWYGEALMPEVRVGAAAFVHRGVAYLAGGFFQRAPGDPVAPAAHVLAYDLRHHAFVDGPADLPTPRVSLACAARRGFAYCAGGFVEGGDNVATAERLDLGTGAWSALPDLPVALSDLAATATDEGVVFAGGLTDDFTDAAGVYGL